MEPREASEPSAVRWATTVDLAELEKRVTSKIDTLTSALFKFGTVLVTVGTAIGVAIYTHSGG